MRIVILPVCLLSLSLSPMLAQQDVMTTFIGGGPNNIPATNANVFQPNGITVDGAGNYYIAAAGANRVYRVNTKGILTLVAGNGLAGELGDGVAGGATNAELKQPVGVAVDGQGNVYISDFTGCVVRKVDTTGTINTIAGTPGSCGFGGDNGSGTSAKLFDPYGLALDGAGNLYIADQENCRIRKLVLSSGIINTVAGSGSCTYTGDGGAATAAGLPFPTGVAVDNAGDLFIGDLNSYRIREVTASNSTINTVAGSGVNGYAGDNGIATSAKIGQPQAGVAVNGAGTLVTITDFTHAVVRQFNVTGIPNAGTITTIAGTGFAGYSGDGGPADAATFNGPASVAVSSSGLVLVADYNNYRIRAFDISGNPNTATINTVAGNGNRTYPNLVSGVPASGVVFNDPFGLLVDPSGNTFVADYGNCMVFELVKATGLVNFFAGSAAANSTTGTCGFSGAGGPATSAQLKNVTGLARDSQGNIYISDYGNCAIWQVAAATGNISIFAGTNPPVCGYSGDGGPATSARLFRPEGLFVDKNNNLYIADTFNNRVRVVSGGVINTVAGNGTAGYVGDGTPATNAELHEPSGVALDSAGNIYIADFSNCVIREIAASTGIINTIAGTGSCSFNGDGPALEHNLSDPYQITIDANANLFVTEYNGERVRWINTAGMMTTIAGSGTVGYNGDGSLAINSEINFPAGIAQDPSGNYLIADQNNLRVREVSAFSAANPSSSNLTFGDVTIGATSNPQILTLSAMGTVNVNNISITGPFKEADNCSELTNGTACKVWVTFVPTVAGTATGAINIQDSGFFTNTSTVSLQGTGSAIFVSGGPLIFASQGVGTTSGAKTVTVTNTSAASVTMGAISVSDADYAISAKTCPASGSALAAGAKCTVSVVFAPKTTGTKKAALIIRDSDPSTPQLVGMTGSGTSLVVLTPSSLTFPPQPVGTSSGFMTVQLKNNTTASLTLGTPAVTVAAPFFVNAAGTGCFNGRIIAAGQTCVISLFFMPTALGFANATVNVADNDSTSPQTIALSGSGTGVLFSPTSINLTSPVGRQTSSSVTLTNVGSLPITFNVAAIIGPNKADWSTNASNPPCNGALAAGASCTFTVFFTPSVTGAESATYVVYDNSAGSPQSLPLTGTGQ